MVTNYIFIPKKPVCSLSFTSISSGLLNFFLLLLFIPILGLQGAAIAFAISMGVRFLLTW